MKNRTYTKTELGMTYGMAIGAAFFLIMFALTNNILWISAVGVGLALGLGIGAKMEKKEEE